MAVKFQLRKGMRDGELIDMLTKGRQRIGAAGETSEAVVEMLEQTESQLDYQEMFDVQGGNGAAGEPSIEVLKCSSQYAILRHNRWSYRDNFRTGALVADLERTEYYVAGINDERHYFVRQLAGIPESKLVTSGKAVDWLNREDQGFHRIQGDLVIKFMPYSRYNRLAQSHNGRRRYRYRLGIASSGSSHHHQGRRRQLEDRAFMQDDYSKVLRPFIDDWIHTDFGNHTVSVEGDREVMLAPSLQGRGKIMEPLIIEGEELVFEHPEHRAVAVEMPEDHYAVLMSQRGAMPVLRESSRTIDFPAQYD